MRHSERLTNLKGAYMEAINVSIKQRPSKDDWQVTVQRRGYSTDTFCGTYREVITKAHKILSMDCVYFDGEPVDDRG